MGRCAGPAGTNRAASLCRSSLALAPCQDIPFGSCGFAARCEGLTAAAVLRKACTGPSLHHKRQHTHYVHRRPTMSPTQGITEAWALQHFCADSDLLLAFHIIQQEVYVFEALARRLLPALCTKPRALAPEQAQPESRPQTGGLTNTFLPCACCHTLFHLQGLFCCSVHHSGGQVGHACHIQAKAPICNPWG